MNGTNYDICHRMIQYLLTKVGVVETITNVVEQTIECNTMQHQHDAEAYQSWFKKDRCTRFTTWITCTMTSLKNLSIISLIKRSGIDSRIFVVALQLGFMAWCLSSKPRWISSIPWRSTVESCQAWFAVWSQLVAILVITNRFLLPSDHYRILGSLKAGSDA